jgi:glycosyltransferase involved in cell wall biosynthesis
MIAPLVSIHCLTFNHAKYIRLCLDGFIMQKTNFSFEVLIHDDASTDGTQNIIMEYQQKFPEIIKPIYQTENQYSKGIGVSNFNYERIQGKYVALCEGDDYWTYEKKLQIQVDFMESHPECSVCFHPVSVVWEDNSKPSYIFPSREARFNKEVLGLKDLLKANFIQTNSVMYRWQFYGKNYEVFYPDNILPLDWYWHLFHSKYGSICFIDKCMGVYNKHSGGMWYGNFLLNHGIKHIKFYEAVCINIAPNKKLYLYHSLIPFMKIIYGIFKENNHREGLNFIENNPNWTGINRGISYLLLLISRYKNKVIRLLKKCHLPVNT